MNGAIHTYTPKSSTFSLLTPYIKRSQYYIFKFYALTGYAHQKMILKLIALV